jgi:hypothetical protein
MQPEAPRQRPERSAPRCEQREIRAAAAPVTCYDPAMSRRFERLAALSLVSLCFSCGRVSFAHLDGAASPDASSDASPPDGTVDAADAADTATPPGDWVFVDDDQPTFDRGDYNAGSLPLTWTGVQVQLLGPPPFDTTQSGIYLSAPFDTGDATAVWDTLAWVPDAPHGRPLADMGATDSGYATGGVSMTDNILLLHLDSNTWSDGAMVTDTSGHGHHGVLRFNGQSASRVDGPFGDALDIQRDAWVTLDGNYFDFGTGDFTYSIWVKMRACAESNDNRVAMGGGGGGDMPHMWIGSLCPERCAGNDGAFMNFLDDTRDGPSLQACTGVNLRDGEWHHLAGVKSGHTPALVTLFVDGREVAADTWDFGTNTHTYVGGEIRLGGFNLGGTQYDTSIVVDEAAIWKRALSDTEVAALHRRGAVRLELQVRSCGVGACGTQPFVGPDGTNATWFTEVDLEGPAGSQLGNLTPLGLTGAQAQYRARFSTEVPEVTPGLQRVTLSARRP